MMLSSNYIEPPHPPYGNHDFDESLIMLIIIGLIVLFIMLFGCTCHNCVGIKKFTKFPKEYPKNNEGYYIITDTFVVHPKNIKVIKEIAYIDTIPITNEYGVVIGEVKQFNYSKYSNITYINGDTMFVDTLFCRLIQYVNIGP